MRLLIRFTATILIFLSMHVVYARQSPPPLFQSTPRSLVPAKTLTEFPEQTFLENLVVTNKNIFVTSYPDGLIHRVTLSGKKQIFARLPGKIAGIIRDAHGRFLVSGWYHGKIPTIFVLSASGKSKGNIRLPMGAQFPNGIAYLKRDIYIVADSYRGAIWQVNVATRKATLFLGHELLERSNEKDSFPAVNGLKVFNHVVYATNTQRHLLLRIPLDKNDKPGVPAVFVKNINLDDFDTDAQGNIYGATHIYNSVVRVSPSGRMTLIAELAQGMAGCTSARFGIGGMLYVTTTGGIAVPPPGGVQTAKIVCLKPTK